MTYVNVTYVTVSGLDSVGNKSVRSYNMIDIIRHHIFNYGPGPAIQGHFENTLIIKIVLMSFGDM